MTINLPSSVISIVAFSFPTPIGVSFGLTLVSFFPSPSGGCTSSLGSPLFSRKVIIPSSLSRDLAKNLDALVFTLSLTSLPFLLKNLPTDLTPSIILLPTNFAPATIPAAARPVKTNGAAIAATPAAAITFIILPTVLKKPPPPLPLASLVTKSTANLFALSKKGNCSLCILDRAAPNPSSSPRPPSNILPSNLLGSKLSILPSTFCSKLGTMLFVIFFTILLIFDLGLTFVSFVNGFTFSSTPPSKFLPFT